MNKNIENLREAVQDDIIVFMAQFVEGVDANDHTWVVNKLCSIVVDCFEEFDNINSTLEDSIED